MAKHSSQISPSKYQAYEACGVTVFPISSHDGGLTSTYVAYLYSGQPKIFDGNPMGVTRGLYADENGIVFTLPFTASDFLAGRAAQMVADAEAEIDTYLKNVEDVNV